MAGDTRVAGVLYVGTHRPHPRLLIRAFLKTADPRQREAMAELAALSKRARSDRMTGLAAEADLIRAVLACSNVLHSRVLRDYLLYAAIRMVTPITWSAEILAEVTVHLAENVPGSTPTPGERLVGARTNTFPKAEVDPGKEGDR